VRPGARRRALETSTGGIGLCVAFLSAGLLLLDPRVAEGEKGPIGKGRVVITGTRVKAVRSAVVNFRELARKQALSPSVRVPVPKLMPEPREFEDSVNDGIRGEPAPNVPVDIPGPSIPSPGP